MDGADRTTRDMKSNAPTGSAYWHLTLYMGMKNKAFLMRFIHSGRYHYHPNKPTHYLHEHTQAKQKKTNEMWTN